MITRQESTQNYKLMSETLTVLGHIGNNSIKHDKLTGRVS